MFWTIFFGAIAALIAWKLLRLFLKFLEQQSLQSTFGPGPNYAEMSRKAFAKKQIEKLEKVLTPDQMLFVWVDLFDSEIGIKDEDFDKTVEQIKYFESAVRNQNNPKNIELNNKNFPFIYPELVTKLRDSLKNLEKITYLNEVIESGVNYKNIDITTENFPDVEPELIQKIQSILADKESKMDK